VLVEPDDRQIVRQVYSQQADIAATAIRGDIFEAIRLRRERDLGNDVIVGNRQPIGRNKKSRTERYLPPCAGNDGADLQQPRRRRRINRFRCRRRKLHRPRRAAPDRRDHKQEPKRTRDDDN